MVLTGISHAGGHFKFTTLYFFPTDRDKFSQAFLFCCLFIPGVDLRHKQKFVELEKKYKESVKCSTRDGCSRGELYRGLE